MANSISGRAVKPKSVIGNRKRFFKKINVDSGKCVGIYLEGKDKILEAKPGRSGIGIVDSDSSLRADALVTNRKNLYLFLLTADCAPVIFYDPTKEVLGLAHVGWECADLEIVVKLIDKINKLYRANLEDLIVSLGPAARKESYIKKKPKQKNDLKWQNFIQQTTDDDYSIDIVGYNIWQLIESGVKESNIIDPKIDTAMDDRFYSHITDKDKAKNEQGRFMCVVALM